MKDKFKNYPEESEVKDMYEDYKRRLDSKEKRYMVQDIFRENKVYKRTLEKLEVKISEYDSKVIAEMIMSLHHYKIAYDILMDYFDYIPDEEKEEVSIKLASLGL